MFKNLTANQKTVFAVLVVVAITAISLALYFGLKKCTPAVKSAPRLLRFASTSTSWPWSVPTFYKYSYFDSTSNLEGPQSSASSAVVSTTKTNPIIKVDVNSSYSIKIYRAVKTSDNFALTTLVVGSDGTFTDTDNPAPQPKPPPAPGSAPVFQSWGGGPAPPTAGCPSPAGKCTGMCTAVQGKECASKQFACYAGKDSKQCSPISSTMANDPNCDSYCYKT